jgi:very-short-patch-repair endonuclease
LRDCGLSSAGIDGRVARSRLFRVRRGVYALSPHLDDWGRLTAAVLATDPEHAVISHWTAGTVHRLTRPHGSVVHVTVPGAGLRNAPGLVVHRTRGLDPEDVVVVGGLRVTSPGRTALDLGRTVPDAELRRIIREGEFQGALPVGAIRELVATRTGHRGLARLRRVDPETKEAGLGQTPLEDELESLLVAIRLPGLARQHWVRGHGGTPYRTDFAVPSVRLAIEADGRTAHVRAAAFEDDRAREADLGAVGWMTLRFTRTQVRTTPATVVEVVRETVRSRAPLADAAGHTALP